MDTSVAGGCRTTANTCTAPTPPPPSRSREKSEELVGDNVIFTGITDESFPIFLTALVGLADQFCLKLGIGCRGPQAIELTDSRQALYLGIGPENLHHLLETFQKHYTDEWVDLMAEF